MGYRSAGVGKSANSINRSKMCHQCTSALCSQRHDPGAGVDPAAPVATYQMKEPKRHQDFAAPQAPRARMRQTAA